MNDVKQDIWSNWLLHRRYGGDLERMQTILSLLYPVRDKVLDNAQLNDNDVVLDIGCGDGLIGFGALARIKDGFVIFSDISQDLLEHVHAVAKEMQELNRCQFLQASAHELSAIDDSSIDVVTTRSVLIYVDEKQQAFNEFYRVLKPRGRISIFEPINRFRYPEPPHMFQGCDVSPVMELAQKVKAIYLRLQPIETDPMLNFDERDLIEYAERAGFNEIHLELRAEIVPATNDVSWDTFLRTAGNPKIPTLEEAIQQALTPLEAEQFINYIRPLVQSKKRVFSSALAYLWATKH